MTSGLYKIIDRQLITMNLLPATKPYLSQPQPQRTEECCTQTKA